MAEMLGTLFTQPLLESANGIEVRAINRQRKNLKTKLMRIYAHRLATMIGGAIPNNEGLAVKCAKPL